MKYRGYEIEKDTDGLYYFEFRERHIIVNHIHIETKKERVGFENLREAQRYLNYYIKIMERIKSIIESCPEPLVWSKREGT